MERPVAAVQAVGQLPPGFRFRPTDEELVVQYLRRKALACPLPAAVIPVVHDAGRLDPWDLPGAGEGEAYFFCLRQQLAPASAGGLRRRAGGGGYWKAAGKEKPVLLQQDGGGRQRLVGVKTALVFHRGPRPSSRTDWVMHEYRLAAPPDGAAEQRRRASHNRESQRGEWVVCRVFQKKNRSRSPAGVDHAGGQTSPPGNHPSTVHPSSSSSSSCVTDVSEQEEEVSSSQ